jgi:hypothetical protein
VLLENNELYRPNNDSDHDSNLDHLKLGAWLGDSLAQIYDGHLTYFDPENLSLFNVETRVDEEHECRYSRRLGEQFPPINPSFFCRRVENIEGFQFFSLKPLKRTADSFELGVRGHYNPPLTIAKVVPDSGQLSLL